MSLAATKEIRQVLNGEYKMEELLEAAKSGNTKRLHTLVTPQNVNSRANDGRKSTLLHLAAGHNRVNTVRILLNYGANLHAKDQGLLFIIMYNFIYYESRSYEHQATV